MTERMAPPRKRAQPKAGTFAALLVGHRERLGLTQAEMAAQLWEMPYRTYQSAELGDREPALWVQSAILEKIKTLTRCNS
jgi:DNA-binding XRE family transcriptional regulator